MASRDHKQGEETTSSPRVIEPTGEELERILRAIPDEVLGKASMSAAIAVQGMYENGQAMKDPSTIEEWISIYSDHVWSYAGIYAIATTIAQLPLKLVKKGLNGSSSSATASSTDQEILQHPALDRLQRPNPSQTGYDLWEMLLIYLETAGEGFWEVVWGREAAVHVTTGEKYIPPNAARLPVELYNIRPSRLRAIPDEGGKGIDHYIYQLRAYAKKHTFRKHQIVPFRYASPLKDWGGQGSLVAALDDLRGDKQMAAWNLDFFTNGATPEGILRTDQNMTVNELKVIGAQIRQFLKGRGRNILLLTKGLEWETISLAPKDVDFLEGRRAKREAVLACLGVPPCKVGLLDNAKYDNYRLQLTAFHQDTVIPKVRKLEGALNSFLLPLFSMERLLPPNFEALTAKQQESALARARELALVDAGGTATHRFAFNLDPITREDADKLTDRLVKQIEHGLVTPDEAREALGRAAWVGQPGGDRFYMKSTIVEVGTSPPPSGGGMGLTDQDEAMTKRLSALEDELTEELGLIRDSVQEGVVEEVLERLKREG